VKATSPTLGRLLRVGLFAAIALFAIVATHALFFSNDVAFLVGGPGPWIAAPRPINAQLIAVDPAAPPPTVFVRRFDAKAGEAAELRLRALTDAAVTLNGQVLDARAGTGWRDVRLLDVGSSLRNGRNELRVTVTNAKGPALLQAELAIGERWILSDTEWQVITPGENPRKAGRADDTRRHPDAFLLPEPGRVIVRHALPFGAGLALCLGLAFAIDARRPAWLRSQAVAAAGAFALVLWLAVFVTKTAALPAIMGFDSPAHMQYIEIIRTEWRLPLADEGFSTYHPPLAHGTTALLAWISGATPASASAGIVYRLVPFLSGLACVLFAGLTARRLWPSDERRVAVTLYTAAVLPVGVYMGAYLGNESMHAAWISASLYVATRICTDARARRRDLVWLGALLGAALLTKFTAVALAPIIIAFVLAKLALLERRTTREVALTGCALVAGPAAMAGWFYARSWLAFGDPMAWNLDIPGAASWWLQPGFHTPAWLLSFGDGIRQPLFAGFSSYWDGLYSTFWGDGLVAGMQSAETRHGAWNETFMVVGYWLALPATLLTMYGTGRAVREGAQRGAAPDGEATARMLMAAVLCALLASSFLLSLRLPFYAQTRASYLLSAIVPIALFAADGLVAVDERLPRSWQRGGRTVLWGFAGALLLVLTGSFVL